MARRKSSPPKKGGGWVYIGDSIRKDGSKKKYVGMTRRSPSIREAEHISEVRKKNSKTWTGKGKYYKTKTAFWSSNPEKAERTLHEKMGIKPKKKTTQKKRTTSSNRTTTKKRTSKTYSKKSTSPQRRTNRTYRRRRR